MSGFSMMRKYLGFLMGLAELRLLDCNLFTAEALLCSGAENNN
jgi:hypothetical protein